MGKDGLLISWGKILWREMFELYAQFHWKKIEDDNWAWAAKNNDNFSVRSAYRLLTMNSYRSSQSNASTSVGPALIKCTWAGRFWTPLKESTGINLPRLDPQTWATDLISGQLVTSRGRKLCYPLWNVASPRIEQDCNLMPRVKLVKCMFWKTKCNPTCQARPSPAHLT